VTGEKLGAADVKELMERRVSPKEIWGAVLLAVEMRSVKEWVAQKEGCWEPSTQQKSCDANPNNLNCQTMTV